MASTNKTKNYRLNQWLGSDYMKRDDLNSDNELIDAALKYNADSLSAEAAARAAGDSEIRELVSSEAASRQAADEEINSIIKSGVTMSPSIGLGMNSVIRKTDGITSFPKFTMQGKSYVNLLGKDGNCEDVGKWGSWECTLSLDSTNKVFCTNSFKMTLTSNVQGGIYPINAVKFDPYKYYFISAHAKNGNATDVILSFVPTGGGNWQGVIYKESSKFERVGFKIQPFNMGTSNALGVGLHGSIGQYGYIDGIMVNEISVGDYNTLTIEQLLEKYPYIDSYSCLQNPYIEVKHDNLVRNGNCEEGVAWWTTPTGISSLTVENGKFKFVTSSQWALTEQSIKVKPNTNYYVKGNATGSGASILVYGIKDGIGTYITYNGTSFNTGNYSDINIRVQNQYNGTTTIYFDSIMLIEGTTAPALYKSCRIERCVIEGKFTSDDIVTYEKGKVSGLLNWKHKTLYGKYYDWQYSADFTGYKRVFTTYCPDNYASSYVADRTVRVCAKYDGKSLDVADGATPDACVAFGSGSAWDGEIYIRIADTDSGWTETINPNADEIKVFMNGWKALGNDGVARYVLWGNVLNNDYHVNINAFPPNTSTTLTSATDGSKSFTVANASIFKVGDPIAVFGNSGVIITAISGNVITVDQNQTAQPVGRTVVRIDFAPTDTRVLNFCKSNIAPGYEGYQLHYKLQNPEAVADATVHVYGDILKLDNGDNYVYVDSGMVLGEVANPALNGGYYRINSNYGFGGSTTWLKSSAETISTIYRNQNQDGKWTNIAAPTPSESNGKISAYIVDSNYDSNALYTVDYQILKHIHTTPASLMMQYQQDVLSAVVDLADGLNSRQKADRALDGLVDLSVYERYEIYHLMGRAIQYSTSDYRIFAPVTFLPKKCVPIITVNIFGAYYFDGAGGFLLIPAADIQMFMSNISKNYVAMRASYIGASSTIKTAVLNYGIDVILSLTFDCRGRV